MPAMDVRSIIACLGGPVAVARRCGVRSQAVSLWALKGRIPAARVPTLEAMAQETGAPVRAEQMRPDIDWSALRRACGHTVAGCEAA